jgi:hypothetical protein
MHVLERMTPDEGKELQALLLVWKQTQATRAQHEEAKKKIDDALYALARQSNRDVREAFAAYIEGKPAPAAVTGLSKADLQEALAGAKAVIEEDRQTEERALGALRARTVAIEKACVARLGPDLVAAARRVDVLWRAIAGAQEHVFNVAKEHVVDPAEWTKFYIPSPSKDVGIDLGDHWHTHVLAQGGTTREYDAIASNAAVELERAIIAAVGMSPFHGAPTGVSYVPPVMATSEKEEASRRSRRAALDKAAKELM